MCMSLVPDQGVHLHAPCAPPPRSQWYSVVLQEQASSMRVSRMDTNCSLWTWPSRGQAPQPCEVSSGQRLVLGWTLDRGLLDTLFWSLDPYPLLRGPLFWPTRFAAHLIGRPARFNSIVLWRGSVRKGTGKGPWRTFCGPFFLHSLDRDVLLAERQVVHFWQWEFVSRTRNANHINFAWTQLKSEEVVWQNCNHNCNKSCLKLELERGKNTKKLTMQHLTCTDFHYSSVWVYWLPFFLSQYLTCTGFHYDSVRQFEVCCLPRGFNPRVHLVSALLVNRSRCCAHLEVFRWSFDLPNNSCSEKEKGGVRRGKVKRDNFSWFFLLLGNKDCWSYISNEQ